MRAEEVPSEKQMRRFGAFISELEQLRERAKEGHRVERKRVQTRSVLFRKPLNYAQFATILIYFH